MSFLREMLIQGDRGLKYLPIINDTIMATRKKSATKRAERPNKKYGIYPSSISHPCQRSLYYGYFNVPQSKKSVQLLRVFDTGDSMHSRYHNYAKKAGILVACEMRVENKTYKMRGRLDQLVLLDNELYVVDLKSMNNDRFAELQGVPPRDYYEQLQVYMWLLNTLFEQGSKRKVFVAYKEKFPIKKSLLVIENKNDQRQEELLIPYNEECVATIVEKVKELIGHINNNKVPDKEFAEDSRECRRCYYRAYCYSDKGEVING